MERCRLAAALLTLSWEAAGAFHATSQVESSHSPHEVVSILQTYVLATVSEDATLELLQLGTLAHHGFKVEARWSVKRAVTKVFDKSEEARAEQLRASFKHWEDFRDPNDALTSTGRLAFFATYVVAWLCFIFAVRSCAEPPSPPAAQLLLKTPSGLVSALAEIRGGRRLQSLVECLLDAAKAHPGKTALVVWVSGARVEVTYGDLSAKVERTARQLMSLGVKGGDRVVIALHRGVHQIVAFFGTLAVGAVVVPVDPDAPLCWLESVLEESKSRVFIEEVGGYSVSPGSPAGRGNDVWRQIQLVEAPSDCAPLRSTGGADLALLAEPLPLPGFHSDAVLWYRSDGVHDRLGNLGLIGVMHTHALLLISSEHLAQDAGITPNSTCLARSSLVSPFFRWEALPAFLVGATVVVSETDCCYDPSVLSEVMESESVTVAVLPATGVRSVLESTEQHGTSFPKLEDLVCMGEPLAVTLATRCAKLLPRLRLHNSYQVPESAALCWHTVSAMPEQDPLKPVVSVGQPQTGLTVLVLGRDLQPVAAGEEGEIFLAGPVVDRYWGHPAGSHDRFVEVRHEGRFFRTGDIGKWVEGNLQISGNIERSVTIEGLRVDPEGVEAVIAESLDRLRQVALEYSEPIPQVRCVGTPGSDAEVCDLVAFVSPQLHGFTLNSVQACCEKQLPPNAVPAHFVSLSTFPKLPNGEVDILSLQSKASELHTRTPCSTRSARSIGGEPWTLTNSLETSTERMVVNRCFTVFMLAILIDHAMRCCTGLGSFCAELAGEHVKLWTELMVRSVGGGGQQAIYGFLMLAAFADSCPTKGLGGLRLGMRDLFLLLAFLARHLVIPDLMMELVGAEAVTELYGNTGITWFLPIFLISRVLIFLAQKVGLSPGVQTLLLVALSLRPSSLFPDVNICANMHPGPVLRELYRVLQSLDLCGLAFPRWMCFRVLSYMAMYYYSRPALGAMKPFLPQGPTWSAAAFALSWIIGMWASLWHYPLGLLQPEAKSLSVNMYWEFLVCCSQPILLACGMVYFPVDLSYWGEVVIFAYLTHFYFLSEVRWATALLLPYLQWDPSGFLGALLVVMSCFLLLTVLTVVGRFLLYTPLLLFHYGVKLVYGRR